MSAIAKQVKDQLGKADYLNFRHAVDALCTELNNGCTRDQATLNIGSKIEWLVIGHAVNEEIVEQFIQERLSLVEAA